MAALYASEPSANATEAGERRARGIGEHPLFADGGAARLQAFKGEFRSQMVEHDGQERYQLDGYASTTERGYEMWDFFGPYTEIMSATAFDETLAAEPDVAFLVNHRGVTMARTTNGTLQLEADALGLKSRAFVNPKRQDVRDLIVAVDDKDITEMSFAFMIEDGEWSEDYMTFRINRVDIDRGDVSAVNYGANPYTSVAARQREILADLDHLPTGAAQVAYERLRCRSDLSIPKPAPPAVTPAAPGPGEMSLELAFALAALD